ncbi:MAG TPA: NCS2 family permease [Phycisphaerae bacterium]|nr:NCS2 family permease [Phycisphaerae bacterium]
MFQIHQRGSTVGREVLGGVTTFMAMSYILFVQPALLTKAGMDTGGVFMATCVSSAAACILMGLLANYPIALAPGMGENFFFVFTLCGVSAAAGDFKLSWQEALALTVVAGGLFLLLSLVGFRSMVLNAIPDALKSGIAAGIGLFIALIGFEWGNLVEPNPVTCLTFAKSQGNYVAALTLAGLGLTLALVAFRVRGAILIGILAITAATWAVGRIWGVPAVQYQGFVGVPSGLGKTAGAAFTEGFGSLWGKLLSRDWIQIVSFAFILLFMDLFDTVGTLVGVSRRAGLMVNGHLPRAERALAADAAGTVIGAGLGTSTVTSYIESITGVSAGARTGLAAIVAGGCMLLAMLFQPLVEMVGGGVRIGTYPWGDPILRYPMIAPALIVVGAMMMRAIRDVQWDDLTEALPGFLAMVTMAFAYSISAGIAIGFVSYAFGKLVTGRFRECPLIVYIFAILFVVQYVFVMP